MTRIYLHIYDNRHLNDPACPDTLSMLVATKPEVYGDEHTFVSAADMKAEIARLEEVAAAFAQTAYALIEKINVEKSVMEPAVQMLRARVDPLIARRARAWWTDYKASK